LTLTLKYESGLHSSLLLDWTLAGFPGLVLEGDFLIFLVLGSVLISAESTALQFRLAVLPALFSGRLTSELAVDLGESDLGLGGLELLELSGELRASNQVELNTSYLSSCCIGRRESFLRFLIGAEPFILLLIALRLDFLTGLVGVRFHMKRGKM